ncbi:MAG: SoxR reducing system RseC family protein [Prevotella sp.]|nr:SoxR reducing system RseC family protein [Prevotella sp.]
MNKISHEGVVQSVGADQLEVRIIQSSACAACKVATHCSAAESKEKIVHVKCANAMELYQVGDIVTVSMSSKNGRDAVMLGFVFPFLLLVTVLVLSLRFTRDEGIAAIVSIVALIPYYIGLWAFNEKVKRRFAFSIEK